MRVILPLRPLYGFMTSYLCAGSTRSKLITASQDVATIGSRQYLCFYHRPVPAECTSAGIAHLITDMLDLFMATSRWRDFWTRIGMCPFYWQYMWSRSGCTSHNLNRFPTPRWNPCSSGRSVSRCSFKSGARWLLQEDILTSKKVKRNNEEVHFYCWKMRNRVMINNLFIKRWFSDICWRRYQSPGIWRPYRYKCFGGASCLHIQGTQLTKHNSRRCKNPEYLSATRVTVKGSRYILWIPLF